MLVVSPSLRILSKMALTPLMEKTCKKPVRVPTINTEVLLNVPTPRAVGSGPCNENVTYFLLIKFYKMIDR